MKTGAKGIELIKHFEGFESKAYLDIVGVLTIGYGTTKGVSKGMVITESQGEDFLKRDLAYFEDKVKKLVKVDLTQNQFDALIAWTYNLGEGNLASSTMLQKINSSKFSEVPAQMMRWNKAGGKEVAGLTRRRWAEAQLFEKDILDFNGPEKK